MPNTAARRGKLYQRIALEQRYLMLYFFAASLAALVNFLSRFVYNMFIPFEWSVAAGYFSGMGVNFAICKHLVFGAARSGKWRQEWIRFVIVAVIGLGANIGVASTVLSLLDPSRAGEFSRALAHGAGIGSGFFLNFAGHRLFTFASREHRSLPAADSQP